VNSHVNSLPIFSIDPLTKDKFRPHITGWNDPMAIHRTPAPDPEEIALKALSFLASDPDRLGAFLAVTGLGPDTIRASARQPGFLLAVLDHLAADEALLLAFAANMKLDPTAVGNARLQLDAIAHGRRLP